MIVYLNGNKKGKNISGEGRGRTIYMLQRQREEKGKVGRKIAKAQNKCLLEKRKSLKQKIKHLETVERGSNARRNKPKAICRRRFCHIAN